MTTVYTISLGGEGVDESDAKTAFEAAVSSLWGNTDATADGGSKPTGALTHTLKTSEQASGQTPDAWVAATPYGVGEFITPTVTNAHFYRSTRAGTSAPVTEPTWPTNGSSVTDNTVTWLDMGLIAAKVTKDYTVALAGKGVSAANAKSAYETLVLALRTATAIGGIDPHGKLRHNALSDEDAGDV